MVLCCILILMIGCDTNDSTSAINKTPSSINAPNQIITDAETSKTFLSNSLQNENANNESGIHVNGIGSVSGKPDLSVINIGIETKGTTVDDARSKATSSMSKVIKSLKENNIPGKDIQTSNFSIYPQYSYEEVSGNKYGVQKLTGYTVSNSMRVKIRDLDRIGETLDAATISGGDNIRINGINFTMESTKLFEDQARELAVSDAINKADEIARLTSTSRGRIIYIRDNPSTDQTSNYARMEVGFLSDYDNTPISSGEITVKVSVNAIFSIIYD